MTPCDLDELEALTAAATPGPWVAEIDQDGDGYDVLECRRTADRVRRASREART